VEEFVPYVEAVGQIKGRLEGLEVALDLKFGESGLALMPELRKIIDAPRLGAILQCTRKAASVEEVRAFIVQTDRPPPRN